MAEKVISPERKAAREAALSDNPELDQADVVFNGVAYVVRSPTLKQFKDAKRQATHDGVPDDVEETLRLVIGSVYTPGGERVFEPADLEVLLNRPGTATARMLAAFTKPLQDMQQKAKSLEAEEVFSESTPTAL